MADGGRFSLLDEPWILGEFLDGKVEEVSLRRLFAEAESMRGIVGEVPTQTFALTRLAVAILHSALNHSAGALDDAIRTWRGYWEHKGSMLDGPVEGYLAQYEARFALFDGEQPFAQVASLRTKSGEHSPLDKLIADVPNGAPFFTTRQKSGIASMSFAEAARWLVHCQAFDPSGIKSGAVGDPREKGGKGYPIGTAWAGALGGMLIEGRTLRETLLLNLVLERADGQRFPADDSALWERAPLDEKEEVEGGRQPRGPVDLLTWPSRRIRLVPSGDRVVGVVIANGDPLKPQNAQSVHAFEAMTAWRRSDAQEKALKVGAGSRIYMPNEHQPDRALWRGLAALIPQAARDRQIAEGARRLPPLSLEWIHKLRDRGALDEDFVLRTRAIGIEYGPQSATVAEIIDDAVSFDSVLVSEKGASLASRVITVVEQTDKAVWTLGILARNLAISAGGLPDGPGDRLREEAYFLIDAPFRRWLVDLRASSNPRAESYRWYAEARTMLLRLGQQTVAAAGDKAWVGRINPRTERHVSSSEAFSFFVRELTKILPRDASEEASPDTREIDDETTEVA